jgi:predicted NUDIX family NTP pyrophosphohydrolase
MSTATSAGLVLCRDARSGATDVEILIAHPGGPFWAKKDVGAWSFPKGLVERGEEPLGAALRETCEELGIACPGPPYVALGEVRLKSGKRVVAWAARGDVDVAQVRSNEIAIEWPPRSGKTLRIPEIDRAEWVDLATARIKLNPALIPLAERAVSSEVQRALRGPA